MFVLREMLEETERQISKCEIRLEMYRVQAAKAGGGTAAFLKDVQRYDDIYQQLLMLRREIQHDLSEQEIAA